MSFNGNWKKVKLGKVIDIQSGYGFKSKELNNNGNGIPVIKIKNLTPPRINTDDIQYYNGNDLEELDRYFLKYGDILISMTGSHVTQMSSAVGKVSKIQVKNEKFLLNQRVGKFEIIEDGLIDHDFLYYLVSKENFQYKLASGASGSANQANISSKQIKSISVNLPSKNEQKKIANILSTLDKKIENNIKMNKTLEEIAQAIYKNWFVDFEPFQDKEFVDSELGKIPKGWKVENISKEINITYGKNLAKKNMLEKGYDVFSASGLVGFYDKYLYEDPQILMTCRGSGCGDIMESNPKSFVTNNCLVFEINDDSIINRFFLKYYLLNSNRNQFITGSAQPQITITNISNMNLLIPNKKLVNQFSEIVKKINTKIRNNKKENKLLSDIRDTLLPKLMSGEIRVEPDDKEKVGG